MTVYRNRRYLNLVAVLPCMRCGVSDGTIVPAHYFGPRRHAFGGGMGIKGTDAAMAALCFHCHQHMDQYHDGNNIERSEEFLFLIVKTFDALMASDSIQITE